MENNRILESLGQPEALEEFYQKSPKEFKSQFEEAFRQFSDSESLRVWNARISYIPSPIHAKLSVLSLTVLCLATSAIVKIPEFLPVNEEWFYARFSVVSVIGAIAAYFIIVNEVKGAALWSVTAGLAFGVAFLILIPEMKTSDSIVMSLVHLPLFCLSLTAIAFMGAEWKCVESRLDFIRYLGEMTVYSLLILFGGIVLTLVTFGLFSLTGVSIDDWYSRYVIVSGIVSAPIVATYIYDTVLERKGKFASILANIFAPLFLITVMAYLITTIWQGKSPYTDRDFLIVFNGLLVVILALTIFSVSEMERSVEATRSDYINALLIGATLLVNTIALTAIIFRWAEYGLTVNRVVVTGANILIFIHLTLLLRAYIGHLAERADSRRLESAIANYLPVYTLWSLFVAVVLPVVFWFE